MKALTCHVYGPPENLCVEELPSPAPGRGQVAIDVKASALNFPDALMVQGLYQVKPPLPFCPGAELAGVITALGEGVEGLRQGDRVIAFPGTGAFAEECVAAAERVLLLPPNMDFPSGAALLLTYGTSLHALRDRAGLREGEWLLVLGAAGGVGAAAIEIAKALGARVIAAASNTDKLDLCRKLGADATIDYTREDVRQRALEITAGRGVDVVYDPVGGTYAEAALRALAWRGRFLVVGFASGDIPKIPLNLALLKERSLLGVYWGDAVRTDPQHHLRNVRQLMDWFAQGRIHPHISEQVPLRDAPLAMRHLLERRIKGKVVVLPEA